MYTTKMTISTNNKFIYKKVAEKKRKQCCGASGQKYKKVLAQRIVKECKN